MADETPAMKDEFTSIMMMLFQNPPDPNERIPVWNRKGTIYGITIPLQVLCWVFVASRLHTRLRVVREPGLDGLFVVLAALFNLAALVGFLLSLNYGMGRHLIYIIPVLKPTMMTMYINNASYHTTTVCIKISLLLQYLRMFRNGARRIVCKVVLGLVGVWSLVFLFMAWFPCFPVSAFWTRAPGAKCYGYGYSSVGEAKASVLAFAATNMMFDFIIFAIPLTEYCRNNLRRKEVIAMTGLFAFGAIAVLMSVLRLWAMFKHNKSSIQSFDYVWWYPEVIIISFIEVSFAIMCASMPIFWPTVVANWGHIFITNEVRVTSHERLDSVTQDQIELTRAGSLKSVDSTKGLTRVESEGNIPYDSGYLTQPGKNELFSTMHVEVRPQSHKSRDKQGRAE
ncbi:hypothetical protein COCC4DRAFT_31540 [Bipolaris maydis ATCC 48331]|uniref:Rhodopsin domain-containing protein n=2 Tax=Cochliobolus heterostrophus TaxID=5016 RepID=M2UEH2_COCH5|nr:uncharacterized protein COCC4DRAFT_31540 [Bipolaris maydis ATCC 48331]EMD86282.1 hypothetical protein COCHEDRAFT_1146897 [Bipolaris maydis C5]KAJ5030047.1 hypothetical protein J3E73DRAFT_404226 [Bipolaris maydis]ENI06227.1 hypothetical protein COCC4DRAFT_31540 [Bipolaris maydis ATCC 48331]KAJ6213907.1 hypothetical protein PSV09DRAFT_1146897 [Bipolaris maydis]KAJ6275112.1 hypothetical protein PSV08DRAFT_269927 [Bipolaris maydis]